MRMVRLLARKELLAAFGSPQGYVVVVVFLALFGSFFFFFTDVLGTGFASMRPLWSYGPLLLVPLVPAVSMRLIAEERRNGTFEWLFTLPLGEVELVLGKFLGGMLVIGIACGLTLSYPITLALLAEEHMPLGPVVTGYLGLLLIAAVYMAAGLLVSCWTDNQIVAYLLGLVVTFFLWIVDKSVSLLPPSWNHLGWIGVGRHFDSLAAGLVDLRDLAYFALALVALLGASVLTLRQRRLSV